MPPGLTCLHEPDCYLRDIDEADIVDIVAIHGENEDSVEAWRHEETNILWLQDLLPDRIPQARVLTFGYDSTLRHPEADGEIERHADDLIVHLEENRELESCGQRPIIFICHGHGGTILKTALMRSAPRTFPSIDGLNAITLSTFAVFFFGTPHVARAPINATGGLKNLITSRKSQAPKVLSDDDLIPPFSEFRKLIKRIKMYFMWETIWPSHDCMARRESVAPDIDGIVRIGINGSHSDMIKLCESSSSYRTVISLLTKSSLTAPTIIPRRWRDARELITTMRLTQASELVGSSHDITRLSPKAVNEHFYIPQFPSENFVGRIDMSESLIQSFFSYEGASVRRTQKRVVILGIEGLGKTQLCCKFAKDNEDNYWGIFTIDAATQLTRRQSLSSIAKIGGLEATEHAGIEFLTRASKPWLLIIDSAGQPDFDLSKLFPPINKGHILINTRNPHHLRYGNAGNIELKNLEEIDAVQLFLKSADMPQPCDLRTVTTVKDITKTLGYLPQAIVHAGESIYKNLCILEGYPIFHSYLQERRQERPYNRDDLNSNDCSYPFDSSFRILDASIPGQDAIEILNLASFYHFDNIRVDIFTRAIEIRQRDTIATRGRTIFSRSYDAIVGRLHPPKTLPVILKRYVKYPDPTIREALYQLYILSFIRFNENRKSFSLHPIVRDWARSRISPRENKVWALMALNTLTESLSLSTDYAMENAIFRRDVAPHLKKCLEAYPVQMDQFSGKLGKARLWFISAVQPSLLAELRIQATNAEKFASVYAEVHRFSDAVYYLSIAKNILIQLQGYDHKAVAIMLHLSELHWNLCDTKEAIELQEMVVKHRTKQFGPDHRSTLQVKIKLGESLWLDGQYMSALSLQEDTKKDLIRALGAEDDDTLSAMDGIGVTLSSLHRYEESKDIHEKVLSVRKNTLDIKDLRTRMTMSRLATAHLGLRNLEEAKSLIAPAYEGNRSQLGEEHPWTLWALCNLAKVDIQLGFIDQTEEPLIKGIDAGKRILGENHPGILMGCGQLALVYARQGRLLEAETLAEDTVSKVKEARGEWHYEYIYGLWMLGQLYELRKRFSMAIATYKRAMDCFVVVLSKLHPLYEEIQSQLSDAEKRFEEEKERRPSNPISDEHLMEIISGRTGGIS